MNRTKKYIKTCQGLGTRREGGARREGRVELILHIQIKFNFIIYANEVLVLGTMAINLHNAMFGKSIEKERAGVIPNFC